MQQHTQRLNDLGPQQLDWCRRSLKTFRESEEVARRVREETEESRRAVERQGSH